MKRYISKKQNGGNVRSKAYVFAEKQKGEEVQPFEIEGENLRKYYAKNNPNVDVEIIPFYGEEEFNAAKQRIGKFSEQDEVFLFGHSGNTLGGVPHEQIANSLKEAELKTCYAGSCNFENYSDPYKDIQNFYYRGKDQWLGVNPNSNNILSAMFSKSNDYDAGIVRAVKPVEGEQYNRVFNRPKQNPIPVPERDTPFLRHGGVVKDNNGYWNSDNWGKPVEINSNQITMKGVNQPLLGVSDTGDVQYMEPGREYMFDGKKVTEFPINYLPFSNTENFDDMKAKKKGLQKAQNGTWQESYKPAPLNMEDYDFDGNQRMINKNGRTNIRRSLNDGLGIVNKTGIGATLSTMFQDIDGEAIDNAITKAAPIAGDLIQGFQLLKDQKKELRRARQWKGVSDVVLNASQSRPQQIERDYVRPEDQVGTGEEFFPIYGTGSGVLKNGGSVKSKAKWGTITDFAESGGGDLLTNIYRGIAGESGGGKIGSTIGGVAGSIIGGPVGGMLGKLGGEVIGELLDPTAERIRKEKEQFGENISQIGINNSIQGLQRNNFSVMRTGGNLRRNSGLEEDIQPLWGGNAESISYNPFLPGGGETVMFKGQSHNESDGKGNTGIGINYGNNIVEVENGEPAIQLKNGSSGKDNLVVYGNIKINDEFSTLLGDPEAKGKKIKNYVSHLSEKEKKSSKLLDKSTEKVNTMDVLTPFDKLKMTSMEANIIGSTMRLKDIAQKKVNAAMLQDAINQDAEEKKIKITDKGDVKSAKDGITLKYQGGGELETVSDEDYNYLVGLYQRAMREGTGPAVENFQREFSKLSPNRAKAVLADYPVTNYGKARNMSNAELQSNYDSIFGKRTKRYIPEKGRELANLGVIPINPNEPLPGRTEDSQFDYTNYKRSGILDAVSQVLPFVRPSDAESLDPRQLAGEMFALSNNQLEPVQAQQYTPELTTPYNVSFQDILNENRAEARSAQRLYGYNPAAQSILSANQYDANQRVLGEQFRVNQAMMNNTFTNNRNTLNDAELKNLTLLDQQYQRQAQAATNTKGVTQKALSSIGDKYLQNQLENRTLQTYENMYNYRFDPRFRAINLNAPHQSNIPTIGGYGDEVDENGNVVETKEQTKVRKDEFGIPKGSVQTYETKTKKSRNGSIVKAIHDL